LITSKFQQNPNSITKPKESPNVKYKTIEVLPQAVHHPPPPSVETSTSGGNTKSKIQILQSKSQYQISKKSKFQMTKIKKIQIRMYFQRFRG
jgi:hypothetical protein